MGCAGVLTQVNYLAVLVCTVIAMIIGGLWYSPVLFGKSWMAAVGLTPESAGGQAAKRAMGVSLVTTFVEMLILACIVVMTNTKSPGVGIHVAALVVFGFVATTMLTIVMFEQKPFKVWMINASYRALYYLIGGAILGAWQ